LGLGRAPGSDPETARALRRNLNSDPDQFPRDVLELMDYMSDEPRNRIMAVPGRGLNVPVWILGSSLFGAQLAAALGLPYAFASHFAPAQLMDAIEVYRRQFQPSVHLEKPYVMLGYNVFAADTEDEAKLLASSWQQSFVNLRSGRPGQLPPPVRDYYEQCSPPAQHLLDSLLSCTAIGNPEQVLEQMKGFIQLTGANELMLNANIFDHNKRLRSYEIAAELRGSLV
jgi:luciferase family oxidoreductase group 1